MKRVLIIIALLLGSMVTPPSLRAVDFTTAIQPILEAKCLSCHNPNNQKGDLSLATREEALSSAPQLITPDAPTQSLLWQVVTSQAGEPPEMPKKGAPLTPSELAQIESWLKSGAPWPENITLHEAAKADRDWWAYQPLRSLTPGMSIDTFIDAALNREELTRNEPADRRTLIRRATYDLTGLPPSPTEVANFQRDPDPRAYEKLLDRLLASPRYGERWGRHWLDVVRFGESNGYERNVIINNLWPFRDYVIQSLNEDKPFDSFIREHLAGDVISQGQPEIEIGSAFLVAGPYDDVGNQDAVQAAQIRANTLDEIIRATSEAFLGMTVGCARCHDHKFDPIKQSDYYQLYATFSGIRHGSAPWATPEQKVARHQQIQPLEKEKNRLESELNQIQEGILKRAQDQLETYAARWTRPAISRRLTEDTFPPLTTRFVRLISEGQDRSPTNTRNFNIDEFEIWSTDDTPRNVAAAALGAKATGASRQIEDFADAYNAELAIDGLLGARFIATGGTLTIELAEPTEIDRITFSSARNEALPEQGKFVFVGEYRIETSLDGDSWQKLVDSHDRKPINETIRAHRLRLLETTQADRKTLSSLRRQLAIVRKQIATVPRLKTAFLGQRNQADGKGPFHLFRGGNPQRPGPEVVAASLSPLTGKLPSYALPAGAPESERRHALANWITHPENPLPARVLANRLWHYHFGTGIVDTPSDFGYMGGRPSHPELLDYLAIQLKQTKWRLKPLHKLIMLSATYRQASDWREEAARRDSDSRLLWRFPPRRLAAEEIRDTMLQTAGLLDHRVGGPGFRLYRFMQDNVSTYDPLDQHGPETYRRAVFHQNVRASVVDLMSDFDLPDCAFSTPRRAGTTTPLQALTLLNHSFTLDMAEAIAKRINSAPAGSDPIAIAFRLAFQRVPTASEIEHSRTVLETHGLRALCRTLLNANELIYLD